MTDDSVVRARREPMYSDLGDEIVLLEPDSGTYYGLNSLGTRIWRLVQEPTTVPAIVESLVREFDTDAETCRKDVQVFLGQLCQEKLVEVVATANR